MDAFPFHMNTFGYLSNIHEEEDKNRQVQTSSASIGYGHVGGEFPPRTYPSHQWNDPPIFDDNNDTTKTSMLSYSNNSNYNYQPNSINKELSQNAQNQNINPALTDYQLQSGSYSQTTTESKCSNLKSQHSLPSYSPLNSQISNYELSSYPTSTSSQFSGSMYSNMSNPTHVSSAAQTQYPASQGAFPGDQSLYLSRNITSTYPIQTTVPGHTSSTITQSLQLQNIEVPSEAAPLNSLVPPNSIQPSACPTFCRMTLQTIPASPSVAKNVKIPIAGNFTPYPKYDSANPSSGYVPLVQGLILRCRRCRTYVNPFVEWIDGSLRSYRCNLCLSTNEVPLEYDYDSISQRPIDRSGRMELVWPVVEYIAPDEYMVRPPQPNVYCFLIDVSFASIQTGMVATATRVIYDSLDAIPNQDGRTLVSFITFDKSVQYYNFKENEPLPQLIISNDIDDLFLPTPEDLLVPLVAFKSQIESLLLKLASMYANTQIPFSCLGSALKAARAIISPHGGKLIILQCTPTNVGPGTIRSMASGTSHSSVVDEAATSVLSNIKGVLQLSSENKFFKEFAVDCTRDQICIDIFLFPSQPVDVSSLGLMAKVTGGTLYFYPGFIANRTEDVVKFASDMSRFLATPFCLEAVLRVRASRGISISNYRGNFFTRQTDLLALANFNPKHTFSVEFNVEESLSNPVAFVQAALLHTTSGGERRIRVITVALPISSNPQEIIGMADGAVIANILAKNAISMAVRSDDDARDYLFSKAVDILQSVKSIERSTFPISLPTSLKPILFLTLGSIRSLFYSKQGTLFDSTQMPTLEGDLRSLFFYLVETMSVLQTTKLFSPRIYALHYYDESRNTFWPVPLSGERFERHGAYLIDDGTCDLYLWVGDLVSNELQTVLDLASNTGGKIILGDEKNDCPTLLEQGLQSLIKHIEIENGAKSIVINITERSVPGLPNHYRSFFLHRLLEDRTENTVGFSQWLGLLRDKLSSL